MNAPSLHGAIAAACTREQQVARVNQLQIDRHSMIYLQHVLDFVTRVFWPSLLDGDANDAIAQHLHASVKRILQRSIDGNSVS